MTYSTNPFDLGTPEIPGHETKNANTSSTKNKENWEEEFNWFLKHIVLDGFTCQECGLGQGELEKKIKVYISQLLSQTRRDIVEEIDEKIHEYKTRNRMTSFQDTLFNYVVNVLDDIKAIISKEE